ncbi:MAG: NADH-quinone oxidoreductase subunit NuoF [Spirochaetes bacterium]|nr:NADH-quinone oxidoreductase subunit NuoF [Spirochaetota bacterium]
MKVGTATCGLAAGAQATLNKLQELAKNKENIRIEETGCLGICHSEPLVEVVIQGIKYLYGDVDEALAEKIFNDHIIKGVPFATHIIATSKGQFHFRQQKRIVLRNTGIIDPENIEEYMENGGYQGIKRALSMSTEEVIQEMLDSGLRGRGGAGFSTGLKWKFAASEKSPKKYVICNADEGDPGAFMDRSVLEGDPHSILEGMLICGYAIGADEGYIYCRAEYPLAIKRLRSAIQAAGEKGFIGENILNSDFSFKINIKEGAGAFVCGEETALIASIEGKRGMPRVRPPFPANKGLWGKPTNINNVETFASVSWIMANGADKYQRLGTEKSRGTKVFALAGKINYGGLIEVEMGTPLREIIFEEGGGIKDNKKFKAVQLGGPSGGCLPESQLDTLVDYESLTATGAIMGSGGMVVMDEETCMVDVARYFLSFTQSESCGKCTFCRIGTKRMLEILERICEGKGKEEDIKDLEDLSHHIKNTSLCALGQTAPNPVLTTLQYFKSEFEAHIKDKKCPAGACTALINFDIDQKKCIGCSICKKVCPVSAVEGEIKKPHIIDVEKCIKCGACFSACKFNAVIKE